MSTILEIIGDLLTFLAPDLSPKGRGTDRSLISEDKVRSGIRAFEGRVLDIGTEWSTGVCEISPGHLHFAPSIGIVGNRDIDVLGLRRIKGGPREQLLIDWIDWGESTELAITTKAGELYWVIPQHIADQVIARLSPLRE